MNVSCCTGFAEVCLGRCGDAVRVLSEEHGVQVALEDLLLGLVLLEPHGVGDLQQLVAAIALEAGEVVVLDDLHRDRRRTLDRALRREVGQRRPQQTPHVDTVVHPELVVLDRQEGIDHVLGHIGERQRLAVLDLEDGDLATGHVIHVRASRQVGEVGQFDRNLGVGVGESPDPRRHSDHGGSEQQCPGPDHQGQAENPTQTHHSVPDTTDGSDRGGGSRLRCRT